MTLWSCLLVAAREVWTRFILTQIMHTEYDFKSTVCSEYTVLWKRNYTHIQFSDLVLNRS